MVVWLVVWLVVRGLQFGIGRWSVVGGQVADAYAVCAQRLGVVVVVVAAITVVVGTVLVVVVVVLVVVLVVVWY